MHDEEKEKHLPHSELTRTILGCSFDVMRELGPGFQERIYKNALLIAMKQKGLLINFRCRKLENQRLHLLEGSEFEEVIDEPIPF